MSLTMYLQVFAVVPELLGNQTAKAVRGDINPLTQSGNYMCHVL
jgi:hypothetical protein